MPDAAVAPALGGKTEVRIKTDTSGKTEILLSQDAQRSIPRDRIRAILRVEAQGADAKQVQADVNRKMGAALDTVKPNATVVGETGSYNVFHDFREQKADVWRAQQSLTLSSSDFDAVLKLAGDLQGSGLLMSNMNFYLAPETMTSAQKELTAAALSALRARAAEVAEDLGMTIDHYQRINVGNIFEVNDLNGRSSAGVVAAAAAKRPLPAAQAGESTVTVTVSADVILIPGKTP